MKIYIIGSHGSGKTTLCRYVSDKYEIPMLTEVARIILSKNELNIDSLRHDLKVVDSYQSSIFDIQLEEEQKMTSFVSDRSLIDCLAYSGQHARILPELMKRQELIDYMNKLKARNTFIFFVRPSKATLKDDGVREAFNWDSVVAIDAMIKLLLNIFGLKYFNISTDSMQERVMLVNSVIDSHLS